MEADGGDDEAHVLGILAAENHDAADQLAAIYGYTVIDPLSVMQTHMSEVVRRHAYELLGRAEVIQLVENLKKTAPELVEEAIPKVWDRSLNFFR